MFLKLPLNLLIQYFDLRVLGLGNFG